MTSARRLYRLGAGIAALGVVAPVLAIAVALWALEFRMPSPGALAAACRDFLLPGVGAGGALVLAPAGLGAVALFLGARSLSRQLRAHRRFMATLVPAGSREMGGSSITVFEGRAPGAFCAGFLRPRIFLSRGAVERLPVAELAAVVAHERHHLERRDPLRIMAARVLRDALFSCPSCGGSSVATPPWLRSPPTRRPPGSAAPRPSHRRCSRSATRPRWRVRSASRPSASTICSGARPAGGSRCRGCSGRSCCSGAWWRGPLRRAHSSRTRA